MGNPTLVGLLIEVLDALAAVFSVLGQVVVAAVCDTFELVPTPGEEIFDIGGTRAVVAQFVRVVFTHANDVFGHAEVEIPGHALGLPVVVPLLTFVWRNEVLHLHLFELTGSEDKVARRDLVTEALADLGDTKRGLLAAGVEHVHEVDEHALSGLRAQVDLVA